MRGSRRLREGADITADLEKDLRSSEMSGSHRRTPGGQVGPAGELEVERPKIPRGLQEQGGCVSPVAHDEGEVATKQVRACLLIPVERVRLRAGQEPLDRAEPPGLEACLRGAERALRTADRVRCQLDRSLEEGRGRSDPPAIPSSTG